jgi:cystathionine beta-lyase family protein involved in aluminum resistance
VDLGDERRRDVPLAAEPLQLVQHLPRAVRLPGPGARAAEAGTELGGRYLAIEGGRHRLGASVQGVGAANREQIERVFYRGFTSFLAPSATFSQARGATIQAARELYGSTGSPAETAVTQAWTAVGVK